jgi:hypothetical protein
MNESALNLRDQLVAAFEGLARSVIEAAPKVLIGLVLLILALGVAKLIQKVLRAILLRIKFDALLEKIGVSTALKRIGLVQPAHDLIPKLVYFLALFLFAQTAADALGLDPISNAIGSFFSYLPNALAALVVLLAGSVAGQFVGSAVTRAAEGAGIDYAPTLGSLVSGLILLVSTIMAIGQLQIETDIIRIVTICLLSGLALAFGLSFGLGTREITRNILAGFYARKLYRAGDQIEIRGEKGTLHAVTPVNVVLESEGGRITMSNAAFLDEVVRS